MLCSIGDLVIAKRVVNLLVRAVRIEERSFFQKLIDKDGERSGLILNVTLADKQGRIQATAFNKEVSEFRKRITLNKVFSKKYISKLILKFLFNIGSTF